MILDEPTGKSQRKGQRGAARSSRCVPAAGHRFDPDFAQLNEVARVADRITVLRDGRTVDSIECEPNRCRRTDHPSMVDRDLAHRFPNVRRDRDCVLQVEDWSVYIPLHPERQGHQECRL